MSAFTLAGARMETLSRRGARPRVYGIRDPRAEPVAARTAERYEPRGESEPVAAFLARAASLFEGEGLFFLTY